MSTGPRPGKRRPVGALIGARPRVRRPARDTAHPWWTLSQLTTPDESVLRLDLTPVESYRGDVARAFTDLRALFTDVRKDPKKYLNVRVSIF